MTVKNTYCRICEPGCPLHATLDENNKVTKLSAALDDPSGGVACHKGLSFLDIHNDPARLNTPLKRKNPRTEKRGDFEPLDWDQAMGEIGEKLRAIRDEHGPGAIAYYMGNPLSFDGRGFESYFAMVAQSGSNMQFTAGTQDVSNKVRFVGDMYGSMSFMIPDIDNTDFLLVLGGNPKVSRWTMFSHSNDALKSLKAIKDRGGDVYFVNPRDIESATEETGINLRIKPGTDVYFLAAIMNEIRENDGIDKTLVEKYGKNTDGPFEFAAHYPAEKAEKVTGIDAATIRKVAAGLMAADSAAVYTSTGVNQSRQGVLSVWLAEMINFVTGNLGKKGGSFCGTDLTPERAPVPPEGPMVETSMGKYVAPYVTASMPAPLLADFINNGEVKALVSLAGNPLLSIGGEERLRESFEKLDLMVSFDIVRSASVEMSDYVLPGKSWLEREDINTTVMGLQANPPILRYTDAMEQAPEGRRDTWWFVGRLSQELGIPSLLDAPEAAEDGFANTNLMLGPIGLSVDKLREHATGIVMLEEKPYDSLYERCLQHPDKKIDCCPPSLTEMGLFDRCDSIYEELLNEPEDQLKLISLRTTHMHNSWHANSGKFRKGMQAGNPLHMCTQDAERLGLFNGDTVRIHNDNGSIEAVLRINDGLRSGAVAMSHGYGHADAYDLDIASSKPGVNCNRLMPTSPDSIEPLSHMSWLTAVPVSVEKLAVSN